MEMRIEKEKVDINANISMVGYNILAPPAGR